MLDIISKWEVTSIVTKDKKEIQFSSKNALVTLDGLDVNFPWEFEKSEILLEVKEFEKVLIYKFHIEGYVLVILPAESFEQLDNLIPFFGDVDILIILGTKTSTKLYENIEAKIVVPYGEEKDLFLNSLWQHREEVETYRVKWEIIWEVTEFVNLK